MDLDKVRERIDQLKTEINHHIHRYYVLDSPEISDAEYDELMSELKQLEERYPQFLTPDSPTQGINWAVAVEAADISWQLQSFCSDCITALGIALDIAIRDRHEYEAGFNEAIDMLSETSVPGEVPKGVPKEDRPQMLAEVKRYAEVAGVPYNKLSPVNQFIVTIPPYVFYCLEKYLPDDSDLRQEARRLINTWGFPRYLQEDLGYPISQTIKGAFWTPKVPGFLARIFGLGRRD